jgi:hypothetical protein
VRLGGGGSIKGDTPEVCPDGRLIEASSVGAIVGESVGIMSREDSAGV